MHELIYEVIHLSSLAYPREAANTAEINVGGGQYKYSPPLTFTKLFIEN
jgi:hypothetical protein